MAINKTLPANSAQARPFRRVGTRMLLWLGIGSAAAILVLYVVAVPVVSALAVQSWAARLTDASQATLQQLKSFIASTQDDLAFLANTDDTEHLADLVDGTLKSSPVISAIVVLDAEGRIVTQAVDGETSLLVNEDDTLSDIGWFVLVRDEAPANTFYLGELELTPEGVPYTLLATRTREGGVVAGRLEMFFLDDVLSSMVVGETGAIYLAEGEGGLIAHSGTEADLTTVDLAGRPELPAVDDVEFLPRMSLLVPDRIEATATEYVNWQGKPVLGMRVVLPGTDLVVFAETNRSEVNIISNRIRVAMPVVVFGVWGFWAILLLFQLRRFVVRPLRLIQEGAGQVSAGNLNTQVEVIRHDEIGQATESFNAMVRQLRQRADEKSAQEARQEALYQIMAQPTLEIDAALDEALRVGTQMLGMDMGIISQIEGSDYTVVYRYAPGAALQPGQKFVFEQTYCDLTYKADGLVGIEHMSTSSYKGHPCYTAFGLESYIGVPLRVQGRRFGTLNFSSARMRAGKFEETDRDFFLLMGQWVSAMLERRIAERALRASEASMRSLMDSSPAIIMRVDPGLHIQFVRVPGMDSAMLEQLVGQNVLSTIPDQDGQQNRARAALETLFREGRLATYETSAINPTLGALRYYLTQASPIMDGDTVIAAMLVSTDITERRNAETLLIQREAILEAVAYSSETLLHGDDWNAHIQDILTRLGVATGASRCYIFQNHTDLATRRVYTSQRYEWSVGSVEAEIDNPELQNLSMDDLLPRWLQHFNERQFISGLVKDFPQTERDILEPQAIVSILVLPIFTGATVWGFIGFDECTGERRWTGAEIETLRSAASSLGAAIQRQRLEDAREQAETLLRENEARFRQMAETIDDVFWMTDPAKNQMVYISPAYEKVWGRTLESLYENPMSFVEAIHEADRARVMAAFARQVTGEYDEMYRVVQPDGSIRWVRDVAFPVRNAEGTVYRVVGSARDVTRDHEHEQQIQTQNEALVKGNRELAIARKQAEAANKLKSQFLATMSHELRTPLNAVIGYAQLQMAGMAGDLTDEQYGFQERILSNAQHLLQLINEVLDISKIEAGRMELAERPFSVRACLSEILEQNKVLAASKGLAFTLKVDERLPEMLVGDRGRIKQIIINLVSNAIKFTDSGSVSIDAAVHTKDAWRVTVSDTGVGIPPHQQETVFDEFRQAEKGLERGGTGLGLAIVRKLTLMMGGNIRLNSELSKGSTFTVTLPIVTEMQREESELVEVSAGDEG